MTELAQVDAQERRSATEARSRSRAFRAAGRHSRRVRWLRRFILAGASLGVVGLFGVWLFDPFGKIPGKISISTATLNGSRITMSLPKLNGFRADGRPYEVRASSGVQDIHKPSIVELNDIEARVTMSDDAVMRLSSRLGIYDSTKDFMHFPTDVRITSNTGYDVRLKQADVDFKKGTVVSAAPVTVATRNLTVASDRLSIAENGSVVRFEGDVRSTLLPAPEGGEAPSKKDQAKP